MLTLYFRFSETGEIQTYGTDPLIGVEIALPDDWHTFAHLKYVANEDRTGLVVRDGWVDPVAEPEA